MDRKFVIALSSLAGSVMLSEAHAIGLGEIRLRSSLNEPLRADIKLLQVNDLSENEIIVGLAPKADFDAANVDRDFLLNSLRFRLDLDDPKNPKVVVTTQQPLREPFLNFLVEVQWPSGRLLREYTLLMDLPVFSSNKPTTVGEATVSRAGKPVEEAQPSEPTPKPKPKPVKAPSTESVASKPKPAAGEAEKAKEPTPAAEQRSVSSDGSSYGPTGSSDTTWRIAQSVKGTGSVQQKILAIQRLNPNAFSNGNVNLLKKGQVLKLPTQEEVASIGKSEALAQFNEQNDAWKTGRKLPQVTGAPIDATGRTQATAPAVSQPDGQLKLAAPAADAAATQAAQGSGDPKAEVATLQNELAVGMEELNRAQRENQEIASRAKDLDAQKENAERLLQLQSSEMAAMQAKLAQEQQAKAAADAQAKAVADAAAAQAAADAQAKAVADAAAAQAKAAADAAAAQAAADAAAKAATPAPETAAPAVEAPVSAPADAQAPAVAPQETVATSPAVPAEAVPVPAPAATRQPIVEEPAPTSSVIDTLKSNPLIAGAVVVVLALLALLGLRKKSRKSSAEPVYEEMEPEVEYTTGGLAEPETMVQEAATEDESSELDLDLDAAMQETAAEPEEGAPAVQSESGDVLGEADIYISFGNFDKGKALLQAAIAAEPARIDYRLKLLELYKESGDLASFDAAYKDLIDLDDEVAITKAGELRGKIPGASAAPFAFGVSAAAAAAGISDEEEFDLDLDMNFESPVAVEPEASSFAAEPELQVDLSSTAEEPAFFDVDFDLDAGADISSGVTSIHEAVVADAPAAEEVFSLDFDLDEKSDFASNATSIHEAVVPVEVAAPVIDEAPVAEPQVYSEQESAMLDAVTADAGEIDEDLDFLSDADESATKLDLARAYIDMGDRDGARDILAEVLEEGRADQKSEAQALLDSIT